jgi:SAM-dependent methyltransferase
MHARTIPPQDPVASPRAAEQAGIVADLRSPELAIDVVHSMAELAAMRERTTHRRALEQLLCETLAERASWTLPGVCQVCERAVAFQGDWKYSNGRTVNFREWLLCPHCRLNNRKRFMAHLLQTAVHGSRHPAAVYIFEQVTPFFAWAQRELAATVVGSEYLGAGVEGGATVEGVHHENALALSFDDSTFGAIVSCDVFEHVPDIDRCLAECARVLRPGGRMYFSIPVHDAPETVQRAAMRDGELVELLPPRYHWNPVDPEGSLVFYDHGWDILDRCRQAGFADAYALGYWSLLYGYLGQGLQLMFVAEIPRGGRIREFEASMCDHSSPSSSTPSSTAARSTGACPRWRAP